MGKYKNENKDGNDKKTVKYKNENLVKFWAQMIKNVEI